MTPRIGDSERETTVTALRDAYETGRLDVGELETRLDAAWASRTQPELDALRADLPAAAPAPAPARSRKRARADAEVAAFAATMVALVVVWLATGAGHPWPLWVFLGWGPAVLGKRLGFEPRWMAGPCWKGHWNAGGAHRRPPLRP